MDLLPGGSITASALNAERLRMEVIAQNIANAHTTMSPTGEPYRRQLVSFEAVLDQAGGSRSNPLAKSVAVKGIQGDPSDFPRVYNPGHPHADAQGMVAMPNVELPLEMVDMIAASRSYEANLAVMKTSKHLLKQALAIHF
jgi:flagellar basal-body rod protein FlgC